MVPDRGMKLPPAPADRSFRNLADGILSECERRGCRGEQFLNSGIIDPTMLFGFGLVTKDGFQLKELFEPGLTPFTAVCPTCLYPPKQPPEIQPRAVNVHVA